MIGFIWKLLPSDWKFGVAIKKVTWTIAKTGVALIAGTKIGSQVSPENWQVVTEVSAALLAGGMKFVHDWARLKWPSAAAKWL